jgi:hypothetical protein
MAALEGIAANLTRVAALVRRINASRAIPMKTPAEAVW